MRFICLATLLLQPELLALVLLDEPELGLHPATIALVAGLPGKAAERATIIVSTQSVNLVNEYAPEDISVVERTEAGASTLTRQSAGLLAEWLTRYSLGEIWEKNIRSTTRICILRRRLPQLCPVPVELGGALELDESYFGPRRVRGKRGRGAGKQNPGLWLVQTWRPGVRRNRP